MLLALLLPMCAPQQAVAATLSVKNATAATVDVDIEYTSLFCKDDHFTLSPGASRSFDIGLCTTKSFMARMHERNVRVACGLGSDWKGARAFFIMPKHSEGRPCLVQGG